LFVETLIKELIIIRLQ